MSTNNLDTNGLPDVEVLKQLANEFFAALPGSTPASDAFSSQHVQPSVIENPGLHQGNVVDMNQPQTSLEDPHFPKPGVIPKSVAGSGVSPSAVHSGSGIALGDTISNLPKLEFFGLGQIPKSVGGIGVSPSGIKDGRGSSAYSSYLEQSNFPGASKSVPFQPESFHQPSFESDQSFETELKKILQEVSSYTPTPQLPSSTSNEVPFYFLTGIKYGILPNEISGFSSKEHKQHQELREIKSPPFDVNLIKRDFPILQERVNGKPLIWLDNAATTQKPKQVIDRISYFYEHENSNIHRAAHELAARATDAYENARQKVQLFLNAGSPNEIVFVRGATEAINLVAKSWGEQNLNTGDEIIVSHLEHHANIVPWQQLAAKKGLIIRVIPVDEDGQVILSEYTKLLGPKTKLVSVTQVSNALGTVVPVKQITELAHHAGAKVLIDGAQSVSHMRVDVRALNCDWFVFSGHKVFGPTGIGVVYGKEGLLNETQPWQGGGNMISDVTFERTQYQNAPSRFEAGTGNIADAVGLGAAIDYVSKIGIDLIGQYEHYLLIYATNLLKQVPGLRLIGTASEKASLLSFVLEGYKTEEVGAALNKEGIAVRSGHHCAQPILRRFGLETTVRPSLAFYNTCSDIDTLVNALHQLKRHKR